MAKVAVIEFAFDVEDKRCAVPRQQGRYNVAASLAGARGANQQLMTWPIVRQNFTLDLTENGALLGKQAGRLDVGKLRPCLFAEGRKLKAPARQDRGDENTEATSGEHDELRDGKGSRIEFAPAITPDQYLPRRLIGCGAEMKRGGAKGGLIVELVSEVVCGDCRAHQCRRHTNQGEPPDAR